MIGADSSPCLTDQQADRCVHCGQPRHRLGPGCDCSTRPITQSELPTTTWLRRPPLTLSARQRGSDYFAPGAQAMLQFLPSGACFSLTLDEPVLVGRGNHTGHANLLDVTELNAYQHGVSREHCLLRRQGTRLIVTDLGSTNGTYRNGERLLPHQDYVIAESDRLILGTLHAFVFFSTGQSR